MQPEIRKAGSYPEMVKINDNGTWSSRPNLEGVRWPGGWKPGGGDFRTGLYQRGEFRGDFPTQFSLLQGSPKSRIIIKFDGISEYDYLFMIQCLRTRPISCEVDCSFAKRVKIEA